MEMSASINELAKALCKAQASMKPVIADSENPFFKSKYANLAAVWENCRGPLTSNGLSVVQIIDHEDSRVVVKTMLLHESGEWISSRLALTPAKNDPQSIGSAITYARRYSLAAMVGVCAEDEDDDAERASGRDGLDSQFSRQTNQKNQPTEKQLKKLYALAGELSFDKNTMGTIMKERYNRGNSKELTKAEVSDLIDYLNKLKNGEEIWTPGDAWEPETEDSASGPA